MNEMGKIKKKNEMSGMTGENERAAGGATGMKILVLSGPNLNMLGVREPEIYGHVTYRALCGMLEEHAVAIGVTLSLFQSNHEGALIDRIQAAYADGTEGIVLNAGGYTHTSVALRDAIAAVGIPTVEVHISRVEEREAFRQVDYLRDVCVGYISGHGVAGYAEAMDFLACRGWEQA